MLNLIEKACTRKLRKFSAGTCFGFLFIFFSSFRETLHFPSKPMLALSLHCLQIMKAKLQNLIFFFFSIHFPDAQQRQREGFVCLTTFEQ